MFGLEAAVVGVSSALAWSGQSKWLVLFSLVFVVALWRSRSRLEAYALAVVYFACGLWPIIPATQAFFRGKEDGVSIWLAAALFLAIPFGVVWSRKWRVITVPATLLIHAFSPWGIASPILSVPVVVGVFRSVPEVPDGWVAVNTRIQRGTQKDFAQIQWMQEYALKHEGRMFVFPENAIALWDRGPWIDTAALAMAHKTIIFGALSVSKGKWQNEMFAVGEYSAEYAERIPMPIAMNRVSGNTFGPGAMAIGPMRVGAVICYEQMLPITVVRTLLAKPKVVVGIANLDWARSVPQIEANERIAVEAWARAFGIPTLLSENH